MLGLLSSYFFIPKTLSISEVVRIKATSGGAQRFLADTTRWAKWWPENKNKNSENTAGPFMYNGYSYQAGVNFISTTAIIIGQNADTIHSSIHVVAVRIDSLLVQWQCKILSSANPVKRILQYYKAIEIKNNMASILAAAKTFLERKENIYNATIIHTTVQDSSLVATKVITPEYPNTKTIYELVHSLRAYSKLHGATETNFPMLNVMKDSASFLTMVALPVNKELPAKGNIIFKRLIQGNLLATEAKGGTNIIQEHLAEMENYLDDYQLISPAIPFESLVTDRSTEADTTKWVTRIYYPVF
jgi:hypothetical protein